MITPPREIDGARVLEWAWSDEKPFGVVCNDFGEVAAKIYGLAICRYPDGDRVYRFSCNSAWETEQDCDYSTIEDAKNQLPAQYRSVKVIWQKYE